MTEGKQLLTKEFEGIEYNFGINEFLDKRVVHVYRDGQKDSVVDIQLPTMLTQSILEEDEGEELESKIKSSYIVGDSRNMKTLIMATQIGKLLVKSDLGDKNVILNTSGRIFGRGDQVDDKDFERLMFVVSSVKELL